MSNPLPASQRIAFLLLGVSLAFGFIVGADKISRAVAQIRKSPPEVTVKGVATQDIRADEAEMSGSIAWRGTDRAAGRTAVESAREKVRALLRQAGVKESDEEFSPVVVSRYDPAHPSSTNVDYSKYARGREPEFLFQISFGVRTADIDVVARFSRMEVVPDGDVEIYRTSPSYRSVRFDASKKELLEAAGQDARRRAETLLLGSGSKVGPLIEASQGMFQIAAKGRLVDSDYGSVDTSAIDKTMRVVVTMRFEIVPE
ncbi:MAG: SIMPL domain-containing protein [Opitutia bacterium]